MKVEKEGRAADLGNKQINKEHEKAATFIRPDAHIYNVDNKSIKQMFI